MEQVEDAQKELDSLAAQVTEADERLAALLGVAGREDRRALDARAAEVVAAERAPVVAGLPEPTCSPSTTGCASRRAASVRPPLRARAVRRLPALARRGRAGRRSGPPATTR